ncbi:MAG: GFA family protein [Pseudomonadota bacterium]
MTKLCDETDWKLPWDGGCRCSEVRFRISAPPLLAAACHCTGCQTMTASAFSLSIGVPVEGFEIIAGEPVIGGIHGADRHYFCGRCKSWMFTRPDGIDDFVNLRVTMLDDHGWFIPFAEFWTSEKLSWVNTSAVHSYETVPSIEEFATVVEQYAARGVCGPG